MVTDSLTRWLRYSYKALTHGLTSPPLYIMYIGIKAVDLKPLDTLPNLS